MCLCNGRSLTHYYQDLNESILRGSRAAHVAPVIQVKRRVGYDDDSDPESTQQALKRMRVSEDLD